MEKMIAKDFIEALNEAGYDFEIYGWEGILNLICLYSRYQVEKYKDKHEDDGGYLGLAKLENDRASKLHAILDRRGYFS